MTDRTARLAAPAGLVLFLILGVLMTNRSTSVALASAAVAVAVAVALAWRAVAGWPLVLGLIVPTMGLLVLGHEQSANLAWMGLCVIAAWAALTSTLPVALTMFGVLAAVTVGEWVLFASEPGWSAWLMGTAFTTVACVFAQRLRLTVTELRATQAELAARTRAEERGRIAGEVHDVIGHALTVSLLHIGSAVWRSTTNRIRPGNRSSRPSGWPGRASTRCAPPLVFCAPTTQPGWPAAERRRHRRPGRSRSGAPDRPST